MNFIELTDYNTDAVVLVNVNNINEIHKVKENSNTGFFSRVDYANSESRFVKENLEQILKLIKKADKFSNNLSLIGVD